MPDVLGEFWVVWGGHRHGIPTVTHRTRRDAKREAERLAAHNPGVRFYVLHAEKAYRFIEPVQEIDLLAEIPF